MSAVWNFIKSNWQLILLIFVLIGAVVVFKQQQANFADSIEQLNRSHQTEIDKISAARELEVVEHAKQLKQLQDSISKIESDYVAAKANVTQRQTQQQIEIVKKYGDDADGLANLLAQKQGFLVIKSAQ